MKHRYYVSYPYETKRVDEIKWFHSDLEAIGYGLVHNCTRITYALDELVIQVYPLETK